MIRHRAALYAAAAQSRARRLAAGRLGSVAILLYHRVAELRADPQQLAVTPANFDDHLAHLREHCTPVALDDVPRLLRARRLPRRPVALTFDDGYRDNLHAAKPLLERHGVPATVFVTTGYVGAAREFWWDELERLLLLDTDGARAPSVEVPVGQRRERLVVGDREARHRAYVALHPLIRQRPARDIDAALGALRAWAGEPPEGRPRSAYLAVDRDELACLDGGGFAVGAHTRTHVSLAAQPRADPSAEIAGSTADLAEWLGRPVTAFSYPFGTPGVDVHRVSRRLARDAGHRLAVVNWPQRATALDSRFALPRFIVRDWPRERFAAWLEREVLA